MLSIPLKALSLQYTIHPNIYTYLYHASLNLVMRAPSLPWKSKQTLTQLLALSAIYFLKANIINWANELLRQLKHSCCCIRKKIPGRCIRRCQTVSKTNKQVEMNINAQKVNADCHTKKSWEM